MSGGKGGSSTTKVEVPQYIEDAAKANLARADEIAQIGYTPYYGPDVAAFTPMQQASFQNTADAAGAFGMAAPASQQDIYGGMGAPTTYAGGVRGYSSAPMYEQSVSELQRQRPGQYEALMAPFINPVSGADPAAPFGDGSAAGKGGGSVRSALLDTMLGYNPSTRTGYVSQPYFSNGKMFASKADADRAREMDRGR